MLRPLSPRRISSPISREGDSIAAFSRSCRSIERGMSTSRASLRDLMSRLALAVSLISSPAGGISSLAAISQLVGSRLHLPTGKFVPAVEQVTFSGRRAQQHGQDVTYVTERCVLQLEPEGLTVVEIAPGINLERDILNQAEVPLRVSPDLRMMDSL